MAYFVTPSETIEELFGQKEANLGWVFRSGRESPNVINLIDQIYTSSTEQQRQRAAERLRELRTPNRDAVEALIHVIRTTSNEETRWTAAESLWMIDPDNPAAGVRRTMDLGMQLADHSVALMVAILRKEDYKVAILLRLYSMNNKNYLPPQLQLIVLDETGKIFLDAKARDYDDFIQLKFSGSPGDKFSVKVALGEVEITEDFII